MLSPVAENLLDREFKVDRPNQTWVGDITYLPTEEGWLYLATWIDLFSRKVVGWSMSERMTAKIVVDAFQMAINRPNSTAPDMVHTDKGSQYASKETPINTLGNFDYTSKGDKLIREFWNFIT